MPGCNSCQRITLFLWCPWAAAHTEFELLWTGVTCLRISGSLEAACTKWRGVFPCLLELLLGWCIFIFLLSSFLLMPKSQESLRDEHLVRGWGGVILPKEERLQLLREQGSLLMCWCLWLCPSAMTCLVSAGAPSSPSDWARPQEGEQAQNACVKPCALCLSCLCESKWSQNKNNFYFSKGLCSLF